MSADILGTSCANAGAWFNNSLRPRKPDASLTGWGCSCEIGRTGGHWDYAESQSFFFAKLFCKLIQKEWLVRSNLQNVLSNCLLLIKRLYLLSSRMNDDSGRVYVP